MASKYILNKSDIKPDLACQNGPKRGKTPQPVLDLGVPKPCAEFLVSGKAWSHDAAEPGRVAVRVRVDQLEKSAQRRVKQRGETAP